MKKNYIGIELSHNKIKILEVSIKNQVYQVISAKSIELPSGCVEEGFIIDLQKTYHLIKAVLEEKSIKTKNVYVVLKGATSLMREIAFKKTCKKDLEQTVKASLQQLVPINLKDYCVHFKKIQGITEEENIKGMTIAIPHKNILSIVYVMKKLGLKLFKLTLFSEAISEIIGQIEEGFEEAVICIITMESKQTYVSILQQNVGIMNKTIFYNDSAMGIQKIKIEFEKLLQFYQFKYPSRPIERIYLIGEDDYFYPIKESIQANFSKKIHRINLHCLQQIEWDQTQNKEQVHNRDEFIALLKESQLNLMHATFLYQKKITIRQWMGIGMLGVEVAMAIGVAWYGHYQLKTSNITLEALENALNTPTYQTTKRLQQELSVQEESLKVWERSIQTIEQNKGLEENVLESIISNIPVEIEVRECTIQKESIILEGTTNNLMALEEMVNRFKSMNATLKAELQLSGIIEGKTTQMFILRLNEKENNQGVACIE